MKLYLKLAWRNIMRNRRRSIIAGIAIAVGLAALMLTDGLTRGMERSMLHSATASFMGEGQIHAEGFRESFKVEETIARPAEVLARLEQDSLVLHVAPRTLAIGMASSAANLATVTLVGVDPERERWCSQVDDGLTEGAFFDADADRALIIGTDLADLLEVERGDRVVMTVAQAHSGELSQELFRVTGIFHLNVKLMDQGMAFVPLSTAQRMLGLPGRIHEIAIQFRDLSTGGKRSLPFWAAYSTHGNEAVGWRTLLPEMSAAFELVGWQMLILGLVLFGIVSLGIINTLFMSMHERMFEFGVLRAIGTPPMGMGRLILLEAGFLGVVGVGLGILLGIAVILILKQTGIDYSGVEFAGATIREMLYPMFHPRQFTLYPACVLAITVFVSLYPALYAARLVPARAMRRAL